MLTDSRFEFVLTGAFTLSVCPIFICTSYININETRYINFNLSGWSVGQFLTNTHLCNPTREKERENQTKKRVLTHLQCKLIETCTIMEQYSGTKDP